MPSSRLTLSLLALMIAAPALASEGPAPEPGDLSLIHI